MNEGMGFLRQNNLFCYVKVNRQNLIEDALNALHSQIKNLRKPLRVVFEGEPGVDAGGVQKEFF